MKPDTQCATVITHESDMIDPPQINRLATESETAQPHVDELAASPPIIRLTTARFIEHPHEALASHEYTVS